MLFLILFLTRPFYQSHTLEDLLARNAQAQGPGAQAVMMRIHIVEPSFEGELHYWAARPDLVLVHLYIQGTLVFEEGFDGHGAWQRNAGEAVTRSNEAGTQALRHGVFMNLYSLRELTELGYQISVDPETDLGIRVRSPDGHEILLSLDPETFLVTSKRDLRALHPDLDASRKTLETRSSQFVAFGPRVYATNLETVEIGSGKVVQTSRILEVRHLKTIEDGFFAMPTN